MEHEPVASIDLMERAARAITRIITEMWNANTQVVVFAGPGNNGGDALAVARMLAEQDYKVSTYLFNVNKHLSDDCAVNLRRANDCRRMDNVIEVVDQFDPPVLEKGMVVIDGLFGIGLNKPLSGGFAALVKYINQCEATVVSIDVPSGLMAEDNTYNIPSNIIKADYTLTIQRKKLSFFFADVQQYLGKLIEVNINLSEEFARNTRSKCNFLEESTVKSLLRPRSDFAHKGSMGHSLIIAGSYGMSGAAILASRACLRAGTGKVTVHTPKRNYDVMQIAVPEAVLQLDREETYFSEAVEANEFNAMCIGPGLGTLENTAIALIAQLRRTSVPAVVDADAINILSMRRAWLQQVPRNVIMTPHPKELERVVGQQCKGDYERLSKALEMASEIQAYIILKGHYSALCTPKGDIYFNSTGNSGMATAGSGDVLTGILTALLSRGYSQEDACKIGMYIHGLAGDLAAKDKGKESLIASDIIDYLPMAFRKLEE